MNTITSKDGAQIYYKDWGRGPVVTFSHGWPLNADAWDGQMHFLVQQGFRVVAHDRRGHGRSEQASSNNDMNEYVIRRRVERAQGLMLSTDASLSEIALDCGLADQSHLTRLFRRIVGESPRAWRRARMGAPA